MISTPIDSVIKSVKTVNEHQVIKEDGNVTYDIFMTRAIIIEVGDREIFFEKDSRLYPRRDNDRGRCLTQHIWHR